MPADDVPVSVLTVVPDPDHADAFYLGAYVGEAERDTCMSKATSISGYATDYCHTDQIPGPWQVEYDPSDSSWTASTHGRTGLANFNFTSMDWGGDSGGFEVLYAGTEGNGVYHCRKLQCGTSSLCY